MKVVTTDVVCGAYLVSRGGTLDKLEVGQGYTGPVGLFVVRGPGPEVLAWEREYRRWARQVSTRRFQAALQALDATMRARVDALLATVSRRDDGTQPR